MDFINARQKIFSWETIFFGLVHISSPGSGELFGSGAAGDPCHLVSLPAMAVKNVTWARCGWEQRWNSIMYERHWCPIHNVTLSRALESICVAVVDRNTQWLTYYSAGSFKHFHLYRNIANETVTASCFHWIVPNISLGLEVALVLAAQLADHDLAWKNIHCCPFYNELLVWTQPFELQPRRAVLMLLL